MKTSIVLLTSVADAVIAVLTADQWFGDFHRTDAAESSANMPICDAIDLVTGGATVDAISAESGGGSAALAASLHFY